VLLYFTQHFGAITSQHREMNLQKLLTLRNGYRRLIADELSKHEMARMSKCKYERLLCLLTETTEKVKMISDKIIHLNDVGDMATELVKSKKYSFELELKLVRLEKQQEERISQSKLRDVDNISGTSNRRQQQRPIKF